MSVVTQPADAISSTGAALNASVNPEGATVNVEFQYSTDADFTPTIQKTLGSGFSYPAGVAVDAAGDVFVADTGNNAVKEIPAGGGAIQTLASGISVPSAVAVDAAGDVFVCWISGVEEFPAGGGASVSFGSGFFGPQGIAVDAAGDVFVADTGNNAVKEVPAGGGAIKTLGSGFSAPLGVAVDAAGNVFVADYGNDAVKEIPVGGGAIRTLGSGFSGPNSVAVDAAGDVFVADTNNNAVKEIPADGGAIQTLGSGYNAPTNVAVDAAGNVFVADDDNDRVVELSPPSVATAPASLNGSSTTPVSAALTGLTPGTTYYYRAVAVSADSIVADGQQPPQSFTTFTPPGVIAKPAHSISATGATLNATVNPEGTPTTTSFQYSTDANFTPTVQTTFDSGYVSSGVAVDAAGDVFEADALDHVVKEIPADGGAIQTIGSGFGQLLSIAADPAGDVFVADTANNAIKEILAGGHAIKTLGSGFNAPYGVAVDAAGDVFVADTFNGAVKEIPADGGAVQILASASYPATPIAPDGYSRGCGRQCIFLRHS